MQTSTKSAKSEKSPTSTDIPFLYNGAYTVGVRPVDGKRFGADFVVGSGHKSMASVAPSGGLAMTDEWVPKALRTTAMVGDLTKRKFGIKEVEMLGCTLMGGTLLSMMASFPAVKERVLHWDEQVKRSNYFIDRLLKIEGSRVLSDTRVSTRSPKSTPREASTRSHRPTSAAASTSATSCRPAGLSANLPGQPGPGN